MLGSERRVGGRVGCSCRAGLKLMRVLEHEVMVGCNCAREEVSDQLA